MHLRKHSDQGFDDFRRERKRVRAKLGPQASVLGYENHALRELEQVEAAEVRDQQLTREVHDFFAAATKQAAAIVEKVSHDAEQQAGERIEGEVESFLMDSLSRMNNFIVTVMQQRRHGNVAETRVEPHVGHLVGADLDQFRYEGTTETREDHIGQDPFDTPVEEVQREFRAVVAEMAGEEPEAASIEEHMVALSAPQHVGDAPVASEDRPEPAPAARPARAVAAPEKSMPVPTLLDDELEPEVVTPQQELESFKSALKALVRQGVMKREEARAAWNARLESMGRR